MPDDLSLVLKISRWSKHLTDSMNSEVKKVTNNACQILEKNDVSANVVMGEKMVNSPVYRSIMNISKITGPSCKFKEILKQVNVSLSETQFCGRRRLTEASLQG